MGEETESESFYHEISLENLDGSTSKILEFEVTGPIQVTASDDKNRATVSVPLRIQTFGPITLNQGLSLSLRREQVRKMAEYVGLIEPESGDDAERKGSEG